MKFQVFETKEAAKVEDDLHCGTHEISSSGWSSIRPMCITDDAAFHLLCPCKHTAMSRSESPILLNRSVSVSTAASRGFAASTPIRLAASAEFATSRIDCHWWQRVFGYGWKDGCGYGPQKRSKERQSFGAIEERRDRRKLFHREERPTLERNIIDTSERARANYRYLIGQHFGL